MIPTLMAATLLTKTGRSPVQLFADRADRIDQGDKAAGDAGRAGAAVGLQHVAIDGDGAGAQGGQVDGGPQAAADEPLDFLAAAVDLAPLPFFTRGGAAGQHAVFGRDPAGRVLCP